MDYLGMEGLRNMSQTQLTIFVELGEKPKNSAKNFSTTFQVEIGPLVNKLEYMNNKRPSKLSLSQVLEPSKLLLPTDFLEFCLHQLFGSHNSTQLHLSLNGSFQYFPKAPKLDSTLKLGEVSVWAKNLLRMQRWRDRSREKPRENVQMIVGIIISNSQVYLLGFCSLKSTLYILWVMKIYIMWVKNLVKHFFFFPNIEFYGYLVRWSFLQSTREFDSLA